MNILTGIWEFVQNQILGMKWLSVAIGSGLSALGLDTASRWGGSVRFFLYDVIKITVLLCILIFVISYIQSFSRRSGASGFWGGSTVCGPTSLPRCWAR